MRLLELRGFKGYRALLAFNKLMLGLKMLPAYLGETYEEFFSRLHDMSLADQETMIREAAIFVDLEEQEVESIVCFAMDPNGVPYTSENLKSLDPKTIHEIIVAVCCEIGKIKIDLVSNAEKKN